MCALQRGTSFSLSNCLDEGAELLYRSHLSDELNVHHAASTKSRHRGESPSSA